MVTPKFVPTILDRRNIYQHSALLSQLIQRSVAIGLDLEFTGLGDTPIWKEKDLSLRYQKMREVVSEHALVSLGIAFFLEAKDGSHIVRCFEMILRCQVGYKVAPKSLEFLVENGIDLNHQAINGIPYYPGLQGMDFDLRNQINSSKHINKKRKKDTNSNPIREEDKFNQILRSIIYQILSIKKGKLILHNGLMDLMFLYHSFYCDLPKDLDLFLKDISFWPILSSKEAGLYDTKCLAEFPGEMNISYLSFLYHKAKRERILTYFMEKEGWNIKDLEYQRFKIQGENEHIEQINTLESLEKDVTYSKEYCMNYIYHGNCSSKPSVRPPVLPSEFSMPRCGKSHDLHGFLNLALLKKLKSLQNHKKNKDPIYLLDSLFINNPPYYEKLLQKTYDVLIRETNEEDNIHHTAYFDAFMTAYVFLHFYHQPGSNLSKINEYRNSLYLMGKNVPLKLIGSVHVKPSEQGLALAKSFGWVQ